jgi:hypothetical protein
VKQKLEIFVKDATKKLIKLKVIVRNAKGSMELMKVILRWPIK